MLRISGQSYLLNANLQSFICDIDMEGVAQFQLNTLNQIFHLLLAFVPSNKNIEKEQLHQTQA